jgi:hypothetical protein
MSKGRRLRSRLAINQKEKESNMPIYAIRLKEGQDLEELKAVFDRAGDILPIDNTYGQDIGFEAPVESARKLEEEGYTVLHYIG